MLIIFSFLYSHLFCGFKICFVVVVVCFLSVYFCAKFPKFLLFLNTSHGGPGRVLYFLIQWCPFYHPLGSDHLFYLNTIIFCHFKLCSVADFWKHLIVRWDVVSYSFVIFFKIVGDNVFCSNIIWKVDFPISTSAYNYFNVCWI